MLTGNPHPLGLGYSTLGSSMNIELEEVVVMNISDEALELASGSAQRGPGTAVQNCGWWPLLNGNPT